MKRTFALIAATTALTLSACSAPTDDNASAASSSEDTAPASTVTQAVSEEESTEVAAPTSDRAGAEGSGATDAATSQDAGTPPPGDGGSAQEPDSPEASGSPESPEPPSQSPEDFEATMVEQMRTNGNIGDIFTIDAQPTELCVHGDGFGLNVVTAGANTTCGFARNVLDAATEGKNPTADNIRASLPQTVRAESEATGEAYDMNCSADSRNLVTCTGGNNAAVYMY